MADARSTTNYTDVIIQASTDARIGNYYIEVPTNNTTTTARRIATQYVEVTSNNSATTNRRVAAMYVEVLTPSAAQFVGWGTPL
jgi:hypothetical protein